MSNIFQSLFGGNSNSGNSGSNQRQQNSQLNPGTGMYGPGIQQSNQLDRNLNQNKQIEQGNLQNQNSQFQQSNNNQPQSPLDKFGDLWKNEQQLGPDGKPVQQSRPGQVFEMDPTKVIEAANGIDFTAALPSDTWDKISAGGTDAVKTMQSVLKQLSSGVFAHSSLTSANLIERALAKQQEQFLKSLPQILKKYGLGEGLRSKNPALNHPAAGPLINALQGQFAAKYPNATQSELQSLAEEYITEFGKLLTGRNENEESDQINGQNKSKEMDWETFLPDELKTSTVRQQ